MRRSACTARTSCPLFGRKLAGGDFPEGWQYGDMVGAILAIFADAESRPGSRALAVRRAAVAPADRRLPGARPLARRQAHARYRRLVRKAGRRAHAHASRARAVLPPADEASRRARALARLASDPRGEEWHWLVALADDPSRPADDPRREATSYLSRGTSTVTARTDWSPAGVWFALASAPSLSDHQHLDAGHFEVVRGADPLVIDAGGYGSYSSLSHNVDRGRRPQGERPVRRRARACGATARRSPATKTTDASCTHWPTTPAPTIRAAIPRATRRDRSRAPSARWSFRGPRCRGSAPSRRGWSSTTG